MTEAEIRVHRAYPGLLAAARIYVRAVWWTLPVFMAVAIAFVVSQHLWLMPIGIGLAVAGVLGQLTAYRRMRHPLVEMSADQHTGKRAWRLAVTDATPRALRWLPGALPKS